MSKDYRKELKLQSMYLPHDPVITVIEGPSMTRQEFAEECDVNALMARYDKVGGGFPPPPMLTPQAYVDWTAMPANLQDYMNMMLDADEAFMQLPAVVRKEFDNDPVRFVEFAVEPGNIGKMREWGLAPPAVAEAPGAPSGGAPPSSAASPASNGGAPEGEHGAT